MFPKIDACNRVTKDSVKSISHGCPLVRGIQHGSLAPVTSKGARINGPLSVDGAALSERFTKKELR